MAPQTLKLRHRLVFTGTVPPTELIVSEVTLDRSLGESRNAKAILDYELGQIDQYISSTWEKVEENDQ